MATTKDSMEVLRRIGSGPDDGIDLVEAALALATLDPTDHAQEKPLSWYRAHLREIADTVAADGAGSATLTARCDALERTLHGSFGYDGDTATYDDLKNANIMRVIDRRKGLPIALGILYIHAARRQGWDIVGLNFPGHFLLRLDRTGERAIIDPFHGGQLCDAGRLRTLLKTMQGAGAELTAEHYRRVTDREVLLRLQNNVKLRLMQLDRVAEAVRVVETMLLFAPAALPLWREAGLMHAHAGNLGSAIAALETYLEHETHEGARHEAALHLQRLRQHLH